MLRFYQSFLSFFLFVLFCCGDELSVMSRRIIKSWIEIEIQSKAFFKKLLSSKQDLISWKCFSKAFFWLSFSSKLIRSFTKTFLSEKQILKLFVRAFFKLKSFFLAFSLKTVSKTIKWFLWKYVWSSSKAFCQSFFKTQTQKLQKLS